LLLDKVPQKRLVIGVGLLSFLFTTLFIRRLDSDKRYTFKTTHVYVYTIFVLVICLGLSIYTRNRFPGFISTFRALLFSLPIPVAVLFILTKKYELSFIVLVAFSVLSTIGIHPLYHGTDIMRNSELSRKIHNLQTSETEKWAIEDLYIENIVIANGKHSLAGVYSYPQLDLWKPLDMQGTGEATYNRYAHVIFSLDRDTHTSTPSRIDLMGGDNFRVTTEPCGAFLKQSRVSYVLTSTEIFDPCVRLVDTITYPARQIFIYKIQ
jgi:hypothetical protein